MLLRKGTLTSRGGGENLNPKKKKIFQPRGGAYSYPEGGKKGMRGGDMNRTKEKARKGRGKKERRRPIRSP